MPAERSSLTRDLRALTRWRVVRRLGLLLLVGLPIGLLPLGIAAVEMGRSPLAWPRAWLLVAWSAFCVVLPLVAHLRVWMLTRRINGPRCALCGAPVPDYTPDSPGLPPSVPICEACCALPRTSTEPDRA